MIEKPCIRCGDIIVGASRARFEKNYNDHVRRVHGARESASRGVAR